MSDKMRKKLETISSQLHTASDEDLLNALIAQGPGWSVSKRKTKKSGETSVYFNNDNWEQFCKVWIRCVGEISEDPDGIQNMMIIENAPKYMAKYFLLVEKMKELLNDTP